MAAIITSILYGYAIVRTYNNTNILRIGYHLVAEACYQHQQKENNSGNKKTQTTGRKHAPPSISH